MDNLLGDWVIGRPSFLSEPRRGRGRKIVRARSRTAVLIPFVGFGLVLVGCTDDTTGHQFATDPRPTRAASTPTAVLAEPLPPTAAAPAPRPFADLVVPRGAPGRIYFAAGPELWTVAPAVSEPSRVFAPGTGETIVAESPSPSGDRVAVLIGGPDNTRSVRVMTPEGEVVQRFDDLPVPQPAVEPVSSPVMSSQRR
jgi:hypothetical protein